LLSLCAFSFSRDRKILANNYAIPESDKFQRNTEEKIK